MGNPWKFAKELSETIPDLIPTSCRVLAAQPGLPAEVSWRSLFSAMWRTGGPATDRKRRQGWWNSVKLQGKTEKIESIRQRYDSMESMESMNTWYPYHSISIFNGGNGMIRLEWSGVDHFLSAGNGPIPWFSSDCSVEKRKTHHKYKINRVLSNK